MGLYVRVFLNPRLGWAEVEVEKRISPLRCSQKREQLRSKWRIVYVRKNDAD
jgi:hypothetical protein